MLFLLLLIAVPAWAEVSVLPEVLVKGKPLLGPRPDRVSEFRGETLRVDGSLSGALQRSSAVQVRATGGEGSEPLILLRGLDPTQSRVFLEGVPLTEGAYHSAPLTLIPPEAIQKIDLYPEGIPAFLASDGMGGAYHLRLGSIASQKNSVEARTGSFGYFGVAASGASQELGLHAAFSRSTEDFLYFDDNGTPFQPDDDRWLRRENNSFRRLSLMPRYESGALRVYSLHAFFDRAFPGSIRAPASGKLAQYFTLTAARFERKDWELGAFYRRNDENVEALPTSGLGFAPSRSLGQALGLRAGLKQGPVEGVATPAFERYATADRTLERWELPLGLSASLPLEALTFSPALVGSLYAYDSPSPRSFALVSPRLGMRAELGNGFSASSAVGVYSRAPSLVELGGSPNGITPSSSLQSESGFRAEWGGEWQSKRVRLAATVSYSNLSHLISLVQTAQQLRTAVNIGAARIWSEEVALLVQAPWDLVLRGTLALFQTENRSAVLSQAGKALPFRPAFRWIAGVDWRTANWGAGYELSVTGPTQTDLIGDRRLGTVFEHGVRLAWYSRFAGDLSLEVQNLGDVLTVPSSAGAFQATESNSGYYGYPAPGRRWYLKWKLAL